MYLMKYCPKYHQYLVHLPAGILYANSGQRSLAYLSTPKAQGRQFPNVALLQNKLKKLLVSSTYENQRTTIGSNLCVSHLSLSLRKCQISLRSDPAVRLKSFPLEKIPPKNNKLRYSLRILLPGMVLSLSLILYCNVEKYIGSQLDKCIFNPPRFTPFEIIDREEISSTAFILTVRSSLNLPNYLHDDPFKEWWEKGIWSVQAKQPELQIARSYTPLPPRPGEPNDHLRFLIRREYLGEMSTYLHRLNVGSIIYLRGPHQELEIPQDLAQVVFFAGGTGIAPALQIAHGLLERKTTKSTRDISIHIIWANRRREDCYGGGTGTRHAENSSSSTPQAKENVNSLMSDLERLKQNYPKQFTIQYFIDEENTILTSKIISKLLHEVIDRDIFKSRLHSTSLLLISGPEGFINFVAGPKEWVNSKHAQGRVGGVLKNLNLRNWHVWKL